MPKVTKVAKCRKSPGKCGKCGDKIATGEPYLHWAFMVGGRGGPKKIRCGKPACAPKGSDLTQSEYLGTILRLQEATEFDAENASDIEAQRDEVRDELQNLLDETQGKLDNMPEGLQQGSSGELLQERIDSLEAVISELEGVDITEFDTEEPLEPKREEDENENDYNTRVSAWEKAHSEWEENQDAHYSGINGELYDALNSVS